jgi:tRNA-dihydrouridine synthase B
MSETTPIKIYAAPLQSYTTVFYRNAYNAVFGGIDKYFTPFFEENKKGGISPKLLPELDAQLNKGLAVVPQVLAKSPEFLLDFALKVTEMGYNEININMGCPHPPIWKKGFGSALLQQPDAVKEMLGKLFEKFPSMKCSVKMRLGVESTDEWQTILPVLNQFPLEEIIVHPRTAKQLYKGELHWDIFGQIAQATHHKLVANGNIDSIEALSQLTQQHPTIETVMIGRGMLQNPWLPQLIAGTDNGNYGKMAVMREFFNAFNELVAENVTDINIKRNLLHDFWDYPCEMIEKGVKWRRALGKKTSLATYPTMVEEILRYTWIR